MAAARPFSNRRSRAALSTSNCVEGTPDVSTWMVRRPAVSAPTDYRYQSPVIGDKQRMPKPTAVRTGRSGPCGGEVLTLTPHVGQRAGLPSVRSNTVMG